MRFAEKIFSVVILTGAIVNLLFNGVSCTAPPVPQQANHQPVIQQVTGPSDWSPLTGGQFTCIAADEDGDSLLYKWIADNGTLSGSGATVTWVSPADMGNYNITVIVSDGRGGEATVTKEARVIIKTDGSANADAPIVLRMSLPSKDVVTGAKRVRIWTASPIECLIEGQYVKNLKFIWSASSGKLQAGKGMNLSNGDASRVNWIAPGVGGDFTVHVVVTDDSGNQANGTVKFEVFCCGN